MEKGADRYGFDAVIAIQSEFPSLAYQMKEDSGVKQLFIAVQKLADYTKQQLLNDNAHEIEHCYRVAHEIPVRGGNICRLAIENIFVYSVSHLPEVSLTVPQDARTAFLAFFKKEYCKQINALPA